MRFYFRQFIVAILLVPSVSTGWAQGTKLVEYLPDNTTTSPTIEQAVRIWTNRGQYSSNRLARINLKAIEQEWIVFPLPDGPEIHIKLDHKLQYRNGGYSWFGPIPVGGGNATFSVYEGQLSGQIISLRASYTIHPIGDDLYIVGRSIPGKVPPADLGAPPAPPTQTKPPSSPQSALSPRDSAGSTPTVHVLFVFTSAAQRNLEGQNKFTAAVLALAQLNDAARQSNVNVTFDFANVISTSVTETGNFVVDLASINTDPSIIQARSTFAADIVLGFIGRVPNTQALAYQFPSATDATGITLVEYLKSPESCIAHEVGHIFGADHDLQNSAANTFAYGHGNQYTPSAYSNCFRTIMAYDFYCTTGYSGFPAYIRKLSSPNIYVQYYDTLTGLPTFQVPTGNSTTLNNARVLNEQAGRVAGFQDGLPGDKPATIVATFLLPVILGD